MAWRRVWFGAGAVDGVFVTSLRWRRGTSDRICECFERHIACSSSTMNVDLRPRSAPLREVGCHGGNVRHEALGQQCFPASSHSPVRDEHRARDAARVRVRRMGSVGDASACHAECSAHERAFGPTRDSGDRCGGDRARSRACLDARDCADSGRRFRDARNAPDGPDGKVARQRRSLREADGDKKPYFPVRRKRMQKCHRIPLTVSNGLGYLRSLFVGRVAQR